MMQDGGSLLLIGVGGQGVVLASAIVADAALRAGWDVKQSEVHGMSQRGGVVSSHLRFGRRVHSPLIEAGQADAVVAMEWNEGRRKVQIDVPTCTGCTVCEQVCPTEAMVPVPGWSPKR